MKYFFSILLCLLTAQLFATGKITYIKLQRTACFGKCPEYSVELLNNGDLIYTGTKNVDMIGTFKANIKLSAMTKFFKQVAKYNISKAETVYHPKASDLPRMNMAFIINGKKKNIKNAESGPRYFEVIGMQIDSIVDALKWNVSQAAPPDQTEMPPIEKPVQKDDNSQAEVFQFVEQMPEFPGGQAALMQYIQSNIHYPTTAKEAGIQGKVIINFIVNKDGKITGAHIVRGIGGGCDEEALRVIRTMPAWRPGKQNGMAVNTAFNLPVTFSLK